MKLLPFNKDYCRMTYRCMFSFTAADKSSRSRKLKHDVIEAVNELIQDIGTCHEQIAEQAVEHIHQKYVLPPSFDYSFFLSNIESFFCHTEAQYRS